MVKVALDGGGLAAAIQLCHDRIKAAPEDADAYRHLGKLLAAGGDILPAYRKAQRACELAPDDARCWSDLGRVYALDGKLDDAARCFTEAIQIHPRFADGWHNLGTALKKLGDRQGAFTALKNALLIDPTRAETYLNLGNLLIASDQFEDAVECFERAAKHDPKLAQARSRLAHELSTRGKVKRAESLFRQSLGLNPDHVQGWFGLGRTLEDLGEAEGALGCYLQVLKRRPGHATALGQYLALVGDAAPPDILEAARTAVGWPKRSVSADENGPEARGQEEAPPTLPQTKAAMDNPETPDEAKVMIGYGLAKYHDRRREYAEAAAVGLAANAARRRKTGPLERAALAARIDHMLRTYTRDFFARHRRLGLGTDQPVFIVGLPRSGTTLTEQILSAHPLLHGAGELPALARIAARCIEDAEEPWEAATKLDEMQSRERAHEYLKALRDGAPKGRLRISDKSPLNFFQLAFAAVLFPNARVIHCIRDPRDNALSIWMENFNPDQRYATDFDDLAFFSA